MHVRLYKSVTEVAQEEWDSILDKDRMICSHAYLSAIEDSKINDCDYFYPVVYQDGKVLAHTCIYSMSFALDLFARGAVKRIIQAIRRVWPSFMILRFVECGTPVALGNTISFRKDSVESERWEALQLIIEESEALARKKKIGLLLFRDFYEADLELIKAFEAWGYGRVPNLHDVSFDIKWKSFEEYLSSLRYNYRHNITRQLHKITRCGLDIEIRSDYSDLADQFVKLWRNCYDHAREYRREVLTPEYFTNMAQQLKDRTMAILIKNHEGQILAFMLVLLDDTILRPLFAGLDYEWNHDYGLYQNLAYRAIRYGIEKGFRSIEMGITSYQAKLELGGYTIPIDMLMKHRNRFLHSLFVPLYRKLTHQKQSREFHVFKNE